jgi:hypothetical protein
MKFTKIQGAGNDFIVINNFELKIPVEKLNNPQNINLDVNINFKEKVENLYLIGDTNIIAIGEIMDEDLI